LGEKTAEKDGEKGGDGGGGGENLREEEDKEGLTTFSDDFLNGTKLTVVVGVDTKDDKDFSPSVIIPLGLRLEKTGVFGSLSILVNADRY
jgi:hypothetical protein